MIQRANGFWEICHVCNGNGVHSRGVECDGGGITQSEMAEIEYDDPGFRERYFSGFYDRRCEECDGTGKVWIDESEELEGDECEV